MQGTSNTIHIPLETEPNIKKNHHAYQGMPTFSNLDPSSRLLRTTPSMAWATSNLRRVVAQIIDLANFTIPGGRWQLFEFCDLRS